jgi:hypothetical protein
VVEMFRENQFVIFHVFCRGQELNV